MRNRVKVQMSILNIPLSSQLANGNCMLGLEAFRGCSGLIVGAGRFGPGGGLLCRAVLTGDAALWGSCLWFPVSGGQGVTWLMPQGRKRLS